MEVTFVNGRFVQPGREQGRRAELQRLIPDTRQAAAIAHQYGFRSPAELREAQLAQDRGLRLSHRQITRPGLLTREPLDTLAGLLKEAGSVYRRMKAGALEHEKGRSLVWVLSQMRAMLEAQALERLEQRLDELSTFAEQKHGFTGRHVESRLPH